MCTKERIAISAARWKHVLVVLMVALAALFPTPAESDLFTPDATPPMPTGRVIGRIELVPGVPMRNCIIQMPGLPLGAKCDNEGHFVISGIPIGLRSIAVTGEWLYDNKARQFDVGVHEKMITDMGTLVVSHYGAIHGQVINADPEHLAGMLVTAEWFGVAAKPDDRGYYVLDRVPPGDYWIILHNVWYGRYPTLEKRVIVKPRATTKKVDFVLTPPVEKKVAPPKASDPRTATVAKQPTASTAKVPMVTIPNVSGQWQSSIGVTYNITQQGNNFQWTVVNSTEKGNGTLKGYEVSASWQGPKGRGSSPGKITEVDASGKATKIIWNNGVQFFR